MDIDAGKHVGHYRIAGKIGEGGMGVVWEAMDTRLDRQVAIKILPDTFERDAERVERFNREAKLLASLNHPNIAGIHGLEEQDGVRFLVMELVPGRDLAQRLAQGPLAVEDALEVARQIADALEAAHENGVVHRDLKPANIQLTPDGTIKILDFGLAKALDTEAASANTSMSPTLTTPATRAGVILGTAAYMSPEQAKGKQVDRRADIWAFGCVLYEMLTGVRPFQGEGISETLASVIMGAPAMESLPHEMPPTVRRLLKRCLDKEPRRRLRDIGEARFVLEETLSGKAEEVDGATAAEPARRSRAPLFLAAGAAIVAAVAAAAVTWALRPTHAEPPVRRFELPVETPGRTPPNGNPMAISPDGKRIAYAIGGRLWIRDLDKLESIEVETPSEPLFVFWSADSEWVAFAAGSKLWKAPAEGGTVTAIADQPGALAGGSGASWTVDDRILLARGDAGLYQVSARGGDLETILQADPETEGDLHQPSALPDGRGFLFVVHAKDGRPDTLQLYSEGERETLLRIEDQDIWDPVYSATGHILYRRQPANPGIWALPFSLTDLEVTGEPFLVVPDGDLPSVSRDGTLIHVSGSSSELTQMVWLNRDGNVVGTIGQPQRHWPFPALSPDGRHVAIAATENEDREIWIHDVERGTKTRLTFGAVRAFHPEWSPDGTQIVFPDGNPPFTIARQSMGGSGGVESSREGFHPAFSPDGRYLVYSEQVSGPDWDLRFVDLDQGGEPVSFLAAAGNQGWPRVSPDGDYVAYVSDETGVNEVYLRPFPVGDGKWQVSVDGGYWPRWSRSGDRIYFVEEDTLFEVGVSTRPSLRLGQPREIFTREPLGWTLILNWPPGYDVSADGERFVVCRPVEQERTVTGIIVVENWLGEFRDDGSSRR
jgi:Tol biopolymer transport system component